MSSPYSTNGEWLVEHIIAEGFPQHEVATAALVDLRLVITDSTKSMWERLSYVAEILEVVGR